MLIKIQNRINIRRFFSFILSTTLFLAVNCQELKIVKDAREYKRQLSDDSLLQMVELKKIIPGLVYDLRYGTTNNFTGKKLYSQAKRTYLRITAATALRKVQEELREKGFGLKIFDAYRPYSATVKMWELIKDERYVANPAKGSGHNRGLAADLTIINLKTGEALNMGTGFDNFTDTAYHTFTELPEEVLQNRLLLKNVMERSGFKALETEWWHYYWPNDRNYDVLDIDFRKLEELNFR